MNTEQIIRNLRGILNSVELDQFDRDTIVAAIKALGGNP